MATPTTAQQRDCATLQQHEKDNEERSTSDEPRITVRPKGRNVVMRDKASLNPRRQHSQHIRSQHCQRDQKMTNIHVEFTLGSQKQGHFNCWPGRCSFQCGQHPKRPPWSVWRHRGYAPVCHEGQKHIPVHLRASAKPLSSAVLLLQEVPPKNARWRGSHVTRPHKIRTKCQEKRRQVPSPLTQSCPLGA